MIILSVNYHPSDQYIAFVDAETGEGDERRLNHSDGEAEKFYRELAARVSVRVGMEATGYCRWFERLLAELGIELWIGDAWRSKPGESAGRRPDRNDAQLLLKLLPQTMNLSQDLGAQSGESGSAATALASASAGADAHADHEPAAGPGDERRTAAEEKAVERARTSPAGKTSVSCLISRRRKDLLELLDRMNPTIGELTRAAAQEAKKRPEVLRLMTHPGVGPLTALAFVLIIGTAQRFQCGKQIGSYVGLIPAEDSSAGQQRLGHITKQGSSLLRFLLVEAAQAAARCDADWRRRYVHLTMRRQRNIAKVAMARRLGVRLYWMWRNGWEYAQWAKFSSHAGQLGTGHGVNQNAVHLNGHPAPSPEGV